MNFLPTKLQGLYEVEPIPFSDERGWFARTFCKREFSDKLGQAPEWVQMNHSFTAAAGSIRGMHYQIPPFEEIKLVRCVAGSVWDVAVDLRRNSSTFLQWHAAELSAANRRMLYIPAGFAHGFQTLEENCELIYHHSSFYEPGYEAGLRYDDPQIAVSWKLPAVNISARDLSHPAIDSSFSGITLPI